MANIIHFPGVGPTEEIGTGEPGDVVACANCRNKTYKIFVEVVEDENEVWEIKCASCDTHISYSQNVVWQEDE